MRKHTNIFIIWALVIGYCLGIGSGVAFAATTPAPTSSNPANNGQALEIAPPLLYLNVSPGETVTSQIYIRDISSGNLIVTGQVNDFVASGENGTPKILLNGNPADANDPYTMKTWVEPLPQLLLIPREIKTLPITINVPADASPGGHYGVIRFTATPPSLAGSGVSLSASLGALVLLTVSGNITQSLQVQQFSVSHGGSSGSFFQSGPVAFTEIFKNTGNVHVQPVGQVVVNDMFGKKFASVNVNLPPGNVLPSSSRKFVQALNSEVIGNKRLFGRYTATLKVTYGSPSKVLTSKISFWVIPIIPIIIIIVILIALFFLIRFAIKYYNKRVLSRAGVPTRKE